MEYLGIIRSAFITTHFPPSIGFGGVCESSFGLSSAIAREGIFVDVATSDATAGGRVKPEEFACVENRKLRVFPFSYIFNNRLCFSVEAKKIISMVIENADIVYINGIYTYPVTLAARYAKQIRKPHVIAVRGGLEVWRFKQKYWKKYPFFQSVVKPALKSSNCVHVTSGQEMEACLALGVKGPFTIIPNGINLEEFQNLPDPKIAEAVWPSLKDRTVVLFLSRLSKEKGLNMLINVWENISKEYEDALLMIAGPDDRGYKRSIGRMVQSKNLAGSIIFAGNVVGADKLMLYSRADIFVLPSYSENFGNVIVEALACGVPVITTRGTPWKDVEAFDCGRYVPVNEGAIKKGLISLLEMSPSERKEMGIRGRNLILKKYRWDIAARKMLNVFKAILDGGEVPLNPTPYS